MAIFKGHPRDGNRRYDYINRKIEHLRHIGLVSGKNIGLGFNGGAAPDHLVTEQKETRKRYQQYRDREFERRQFARAAE